MLVDRLTELWTLFYWGKNLYFIVLRVLENKVHGLWHGRMTKRYTVKNKQEPSHERIFGFAQSLAPFGSAALRTHDGAGANRLGLGPMLWFLEVFLLSALVLKSSWSSSCTKRTLFWCLPHTLTYGLKWESIWLILQSRVPSIWIPFGSKSLGGKRMHVLGASWCELYSKIVFSEQRRFVRERFTCSTISLIFGLLLQDPFLINKKRSNQMQYQLIPIMDPRQVIESVWRVYTPAQWMKKFHHNLSSQGKIVYCFATRLMAYNQYIYVVRHTQLEVFPMYPPPFYRRNFFSASVSIYWMISSRCAWHISWLNLYALRRVQELT